MVERAHFKVSNDWWAEAVQFSLKNMYLSSTSPHTNLVYSYFTDLKLFCVQVANIWNRPVYSAQHSNLAVFWFDFNIVVTVDCSYEDIASFPGFPAPEREHWSCASMERLVFFLHMNSVKSREGVERSHLYVGIPVLRTGKRTKIAGNLLHLPCYSYQGGQISYTPNTEFIVWKNMQNFAFLFWKLVLFRLCHCHMKIWRHTVDHMGLGMCSPKYQKLTIQLTEKHHLHSSIKESLKEKGREKVKVAQTVKRQVESWSRREDKGRALGTDHTSPSERRKRNRLPNAMLSLWRGKRSPGTGDQMPRKKTARSWTRWLYQWTIPQLYFCGGKE